ncbi:BlaI/MecI/CopY family transcriptional regulator [Pontibacter pamirensis]|uniref:BlaI/MecI/CopY family transcriptional regulator n=1 Tax=Pontibacter pamirensis TaxID=2562824 RepID=UPI00138A4E4A|nr:BlaI/MecI/CopY family transcriptional regulator [Pontibacter pamirensis]
MKRLTEQEQEVMLVVWQNKGGFIKDFLESLPEPKPPYTTLASTVRKLEQIGYLRGEKLGNSYRYTPAVGAGEYRKRFMSDIVSDYFSNSYKELVSFFANEKQISTDELREIINMIEKPKE